jgi:hypothetical protein
MGLAVDLPSGTVTAARSATQCGKRVPIAKSLLPTSKSSPSDNWTHGRVGEREDGLPDALGILKPVVFGYLAATADFAARSCSG